MSTVDKLRTMMVEAFGLNLESLLPTTPLQGLEVDSLSWLEFSFDVDQHFEIDLPQDIVRADLTLQAFANAIDGMVAAKEVVAFPEET